MATIISFEGIRHPVWQYKFSLDVFDLLAPGIIGGEKVSVKN